jgi:plasmid stabilization system protein ParE
MSPHFPASRRPKVLHCINRLGLGGSENVAFEIIRRLRDQIEPAIFTAKPPAADEVGLALRNEVESLAMPWYQGSRFALARGGLLFGGLALARAIRDWQPDVVHYHAEASEACGAMMMLLPGRARCTPLCAPFTTANTGSFLPRRQVVRSPLATHRRGGRFPQRPRRISGPPSIQRLRS